MDAVFTAVTILASLVVGLAGGVVAAKVTADKAGEIEQMRLAHDLSKWQDETAREDHNRFVDKKREQYAKLLALAASYWRQVVAHRASADEHQDVDPTKIVPFPSAEAFESVASEIELLAPPVGRAAIALHQMLVEYESYAYAKDGPRLLHSSNLKESKPRYEFFRKQFIGSASGDLEGRPPGEIQFPD
jgi:uncharacterized membrane-anchored protein YhcB (DUF1043 family)